MSVLKRLRYRIEWLGVLALARGIPLLSRRGVLRLSRGLGWLAFRFDRRGRETALQNLEAVFGSEKTESEIREIALRSFQNFARTVCDQFWSSRLSSDNFFDYCRFEYDDPEILETVRDTGAIWVTPHYGNFEWVSLGAGYLGYDFCVVTQEFKNPLLTSFFKKNREHTGHTVIAQRGSILRLLKHLKRGGNAAFLTDLTIPPGRAATVIECLGRKTCVTGLHAELMKKTGVPVIPGVSIPQPDGSYVIRGLPALHFSATQSTREIAQRCWDVFEDVIRKEPEHWLWMYKHWRYKPEKDEAAYPPYANRSKKFDRLLKQIEDAESGD
ncbi:MAG: lysophospholipid acyltransferase family protein [Verrucomicrobiales bacterium]